MERIGYRGVRPLAGALYPRGHGGIFGIWSRFLMRGMVADLGEVCGWYAGGGDHVTKPLKDGEDVTKPRRAANESRNPHDGGGEEEGESSEEEGSGGGGS